MMIKDIYYKFSLNAKKTDQLYFLRLFREKILMDLEQAILNHYSELLKQNRKKEEIQLIMLKRNDFNYIYKYY